MDNQKDHSDLPEHTPDIQDVLGNPPSWLLQYGMYLFLALVLVMVLVSWFIKYPEVITAKATLTSYRPPVSILARSSGRIAQLYVDDLQAVKAGQLLAVLDNTANHENIQLLKNCISLPANESKAYLKKHLLHRTFNFGELHNGFTALLKSYNNLVFLEDTKHYSIERQIIREQIDEYKRLRNNLESHLQMQDKDLRVAKIQESASVTEEQKRFFNAAGNLPDIHSLSQKKWNYLATNSALINAKIKIKELEKMIYDLETKRQEHNSQLETEYEQNCASLLQEIILWQQNYLLVSPVAGTAVLNQVWTANQNVAANEKVLTIVPEGGKVFCQVALPEAGAGRVQVGQQVHIKLHNFPYQEYGYLIGEIERISALPHDSSYTVKIVLKQGLRTSYNKMLDFKQQSHGAAEIITKDLRLIERFLNQFLHLFT